MARSPPHFRVSPLPFVYKYKPSVNVNYCAMCHVHVIMGTPGMCVFDTRRRFFYILCVCVCTRIILILILHIFILHIYISHTHNIIYIISIISISQIQCPLPLLLRSPSIHAGVLAWMAAAHLESRGRPRRRPFHATVDTALDAKPTLFMWIGQKSEVRQLTQNSHTKTQPTT